VDFVSEADVRAALQEGKKIRIHGRTLLTPSARELGDAKGVFERT
jgi:ethanolamine utilization cobalamin adenosyltransferase